MAGSLDPHSAYLNAEELRESEMVTTGEFGGLGIQVTQEDGMIKVIAPLEGTPADRAGLKPGDLITHLNGGTVKGMCAEGRRQRHARRARLDYPADHPARRAAGARDDADAGDHHHRSRPLAGRERYRLPAHRQLQRQGRRAGRKRDQAHAVVAAHPPARRRRRSAQQPRRPARSVAGGGRRLPRCRRHRHHPRPRRFGAAGRSPRRKANC